MTEESNAAEPVTQNLEGKLAESSSDDKKDSLEKQIEGITLNELDDKEQNGMSSKSDDDLKQEVPEEGDTQGLDDDEIEENPAYIPKKGRYYMHDSRSEDNSVEAEMKRSRADGSWNHDRFVERYQQPKSKKQLVAKYGFDIRYGETEEEAAENERHQTNVSPLHEEDSISHRGRGRQRGAVRTQRGGGRYDKNNTNHKENTERRDSAEEDDVIESRERGGIRRQKPTKALVRNVRGGRGQNTNTRASYRNVERRHESPRIRQRNGSQEHDETRRQRSDENMENHRKGATRGAIRGFHSQPPRQFVRTFSSSNRYERENRYSDRPEISNGGSLVDRRLSGSYSRGGRGARGSTRGSNDSHRGTAAPKRYPVQTDPSMQLVSGGQRYAARQELVYFNQPHTLPPPSHQTSPVVYFDPAAQQHNRHLPPRQKKIIEIKSPNSSS